MDWQTVTDCLLDLFPYISVFVSVDSYTVVTCLLGAYFTAWAMCTWVGACGL